MLELTKSDFKLMGETDGWRGTVDLFNPDPTALNPINVALLAYAWRKYLTECETEPGQDSNFIIGRDTRDSGPVLSNAAMAGVEYAGGQVVEIGATPTPLAQRIALSLGASAIVITASHNPEGDNGVKYMLGAEKPNDLQIRGVSEIYWQTHNSGLQLPNTNPIKPIRGLEIGLINKYKNDVIAYISERFGERPLEGKLIVMDCANGATMGIAPDIFRELGCDVRLTENGNDKYGNINDNCGATALGNLKDYITRHPELLDWPGFLGGIAFDGDGDRMMGVSAERLGNGGISCRDFTGNHTLAVLAAGQPGIVGTVYTNPGVRSYVKSRGTEFYECPNGDVNVTKALREHGLKVGGEFTGHHVNLDWLNSGDGILSATNLAAIMASKNKTMANVTSTVELYPEKLINIPYKGLSLDDDAIETMDLTLKQLCDSAVVRKSGTQSLLRIWAADHRGENYIMEVISKIAGNNGIEMTQG